MWYAYLGQVGQGDRCRAGTTLLPFSQVTCCPWCLLQDHADMRSTHVCLTQFGASSYYCTGRQLELRKMEIVFCRVRELNYLGRGSENLQDWYRIGKKSGRRVKVVGKNIAAFESPELTGGIDHLTSSLLSR